MEMERVTIPIFEIYSSPKISLDDLRKRSMNSRYSRKPLTEEELEERRIENKSW